MPSSLGKEATDKLDCGILLKYKTVTKIAVNNVTQLSKELTINHTFSICLGSCVHFWWHTLTGEVKAFH